VRLKVVLTTKKNPKDFPYNKWKRSQAAKKGWATRRAKAAAAEQAKWVSATGPRMDIWTRLGSLVEKADSIYQAHNRALETARKKGGPIEVLHVGIIQPLEELVYHIISRTEAFMKYGTIDKTRDVTNQWVQFLGKYSADRDPPPVGTPLDQQAEWAEWVRQRSADWYEELLENSMAIIDRTSLPGKGGHGSVACIYATCTRVGDKAGPVWGVQTPSVKKALATLTDECACGARWHSEEGGGSTFDDMKMESALLKWMTSRADLLGPPTGFRT
jgi:hypothetical protein